MSDRDCVKCRSRMEPGFLIDNTHGGKGQSQWAEGEAVKSLWTGLKLKGRQTMPVTTFRCQSCGYLESYAQSTAR